MTDELPAALLSITVNTSRSFAKTFRRVRTDQTQGVSLEGFVSGVAQMRRKANEPGDVDPIIDFAVEIIIEPDLDDDARDDPANIKDRANVTATREQCAAAVKPGRFDCYLLHEDGETTLTMCPNIPANVVGAVSE